jgi:High potential iron-sulfur protein
MEQRFRGMTRKNALVQMLVLPALAGAMFGGATAVAHADSRVDLKYQATPKDGQKCSACMLFVPGKTAKDDGTCKVITGSISPNGWCTAFAQRPA